VVKPPPAPAVERTGGIVSGPAVRSLGSRQKQARTTPPSTRMAAPLVAAEKRVFQEEFERCLAGQKPFIFAPPLRWVCKRYGHVSESICKTKIKPRPRDLITEVCATKVETKVHDFVPDITLVGRRGQSDIWVEMAVSHKCSAAKCNAGNLSTLGFQTK